MTPDQYHAAAGVAAARLLAAALPSGLDLILEVRRHDSPLIDVVDGRGYAVSLHINTPRASNPGGPGASLLALVQAARALGWPTPLPDGDAIESHGNLWHPWRARGLAGELDCEMWCSVEVSHPQLRPFTMPPGPDGAPALADGEQPEGGGES